MDASAVFEISEEIERHLYLSDPMWWRRVIDPLQEALDIAAGLPAWR